MVDTLNIYGTSGLRRFKLLPPNQIKYRVMYNLKEMPKVGLSSLSSFKKCNQSVMTKDIEIFITFCKIPIAPVSWYLIDGKGLYNSKLPDKWIFNRVMYVGGEIWDKVSIMEMNLKYLHTYNQVVPRTGCLRLSVGVYGWLVRLHHHICVRILIQHPC